MYGGLGHKTTMADGTLWKTLSHSSACGPPVRLHEVGKPDLRLHSILRNIQRKLSSM
jgi:hypothetical protein